ncbi:MAG: VOC family protein [Alphaproteobacteria bacterium]|nr:VOC family protein [Alphaproteobacteria bacterium]
MRAEVPTLSRLPLRLHHNAYVCKSQEATRHFYEDILGLPLIATWIEEGEFPEFPGRKIPYVHTFFGIGDGGALAFFEFSDPQAAAKFKAQQQPFFVHLALAVTEAAQEEIKSRLTAASIPVRERDHGYCKSIYAADPDGLIVEFTVDPPDVDRINTWQRDTAHKTLQQWVAGRREVNNTIRPHR